MPHLSPMNWIMTMMLMWLFMSLFMINTWWFIQSYKKPSTTSSSLISINWKW
uniref:ATP synthase F0 subunit 8 n=1 Tax=Haementeria sp. COZEM-ANN-HIR-001/002 TaxID=3157987 RepID=A0AAT9J3J3_9ANNE